MIGKVHGDDFAVYGARKVHAELRRQGHPVARCTVQRLMRAAGLRGISRATGPRTTAPNHSWVADITYYRTFAGWVYAAFVTGSCPAACAPT